MGLVMLANWLEGRLRAAGLEDGWPGLARLVAAELVLPILVVPILTLVVAPHCHGLDRVLVGATMLAVLANSAVGIVRKFAAAERLGRTEAAVSGAMAAIDHASLVTTAVLAELREEVVPALEKTFAAAAAMAADRRSTAPVRRRMTKILTSGDAALATLRDLIEPPRAQASEPAPERIAALEGPPVADLPALTGPAELPLRPVRPLHVLAAEHDGPQGQRLRSFLAQADFEPEVCSTGAETIEAWRRKPWDLILLDMQMPDVDGLAIVRTIRSAELKAGWPYTPIVTLAANAGVRDLAIYDAAGVDGHLAKPIDALSLFAAIEATISAPVPMDMELARVA